MSDSIALALILALSAAILHALWNVLLKTGGDPLQISVRAVASSTVIATPIAILVWLLHGRPGLPATAWLLAATSALLELLYFIFLAEAYRRGELSVVYPLARGTAPLLAVFAGLTLLGERLSVPAIAGVICLLAGIWGVRRPIAAGAAVLPAILTGVAIAGYSAIDRVGVRMAAPWLYGWVVAVILTVLLICWMWLGERRGAPAGAPVAGNGALEASSPAPMEGNPPGWAAALGVGLLMLISYFLVLFALSIAPLTIVSPVRESAVVLVTAWGVWRLKERQGARLRLGGAAAIMIGAVLVTLR